MKKNSLHFQTVSGNTVPAVTDISHHSKSPDDPKVKLRVALVRRGITFAQLAKETGLSISCVQKTALGIRRSPSARSAIEHLIGEQIWS
jgi:hypothetical protein